MASLFFRRAIREVSPLGSFPFRLNKVSPWSSPPVLTTDTQDIVLLINRVSDAGRRAVHRVPLSNDIHKLVITSYYIFQHAQVRYSHLTRPSRCAFVFLQQNKSTHPKSNELVPRLGAGYWDRIRNGSILHASLVPRLSWNANIYRTESLVSFVRKHDVSKIGPNRRPQWRI